MRTFPKVYYFGGGGSDGSSFVPPADNSLALQQDSEKFQTQQAALARQNALADQATTAAKAAQDKQDAITQFQNDLKGATAGANSYAQQQYGQLGLGANDYGLMNNFQAQLQNALSGIGSQQTGNAGQFINGQSLFDAANTQTLNTQRNSLKTAFNNMFGQNYQNSAIGDDLLNSDESNYLTTQQTAAQQAIDRAHARGTLNDTGYQYALDQLGTQSAAAKSKIALAGQTVLDKYRSGLSDALTNASTSINNWNYGDNYSNDGTQQNIDTLVNKDKANASTDFLSAVGGQSYFDPTSLLAQAGNYQGVTNPGTAGTTGGVSSGGLSGADATPFATRPVAQTSTSKSGLGNQGIV